MRLENDFYRPRTADGLLAKLETLIERAQIGLVTGATNKTLNRYRPLRVPKSSRKGASREEIRARGRESARRYYARNRELINKRNRFKRLFNPEMNAAHQKRHREKNKGNTAWRMRKNLSVRLSQSVRNNTKRSKCLVLLGCSIPSLKIYLESKFEPGMTWQNYGSVWEIDHVLPCAIFDLTQESHQKHCFHFSNLQPLFVTDNRRKSDRILPGIEVTL